MAMEKYRVWYTLTGFVDIEADSEEEAAEEFRQLSQNELENNLLAGCDSEIQSM